MWKKEERKTCTFAGEKFNRWCSMMNADSRRQLDSCQTRGKISTRMESGSWWKLRKLGILFTRQTAFGSFRPSCSSKQTRLLNIPFVFGSPSANFALGADKFFFLSFSDSILASDDDDINPFPLLSSIKDEEIFLKRIWNGLVQKSKKCNKNNCEIFQPTFERYERND